MLTTGRYFHLNLMDHFEITQNYIYPKAKLIKAKIHVSS